MPDSGAEVAAAKKAIRAMLEEKPRPTQGAIAAATGISQGYVAKINRCAFTAMNDGIRKVVEYSKMSSEQRVAASSEATRIAARISAGARRLAARDPALGEAVADFIDKVAGRPSP